ncbi:hypothetical protein V6R21_02590 [Limibacter armeniacum]|uniref:hypothetical protein n=1 Tax=Limibacter armeniacum TaxID=466084 RepID=UPI002FE56BE1
MNNRTTKLSYLLLILITSLSVTSAFGQNNEFLLQDSQAGIFKVGEEIPFAEAEKMSYIVQEKNDVISTPVSDRHEPYYLFYAGKEKLVKIIPEYNYETQSFNKKVGEVFVFSPKFKTTKGIGVGSTVEEFASEYADFQLWYTYISDMYGIDTKGLNAQFLLNGNDYVEKVDFDSDLTILMKSKFKEGSKIHTVRYY